MSSEEEIEAFFERRVKIFNIFSILSLGLTVVGFIILLLGFLLDWNLWIHTSIGGSIILIALTAPLVVRFALKIRDPEMRKYIADEADRERGMDKQLYLE